MNITTKRMYVTLPLDTHRKVRARLAAMGVTAQDWLAALIDGALADGQEEQIPLAAIPRETLRAALQAARDALAPAQSSEG